MHEMEIIFLFDWLWLASIPSMIICTLHIIGLCRQQQRRIEAAIEKAWDHGKSHIDSDTEVE